MAATSLSSSRPASWTLPSGSRPRPRRAPVAYARRGSARRWWSDAWQDDSEGFGLDGPGACPSFFAAEPVTTFFCSDGSVVQLGARPHPLQQAERRSAKRRGPGDSLPLPDEQGLLVGSVFQIHATNGLDAARRVHLSGFCFSTEQLFEQVEDTVLARGGEVFETHRLLKSGVHEALIMTVAIPLLWGVPPEYERLKAGIKTGGGIIEKVSRQWVIY